MAKVQLDYTKLWTFEMLLEANKVNTPIKADPEEEKKLLDFNRRFADEEEIGESRCGCMFDDEVDFDEIDGESRDFAEIEDPRQAPLEQQQEACAAYNVFEEMIQLPASKKICDAHHVDGETLTKVLENLKNSITQEALIQLEKHSHAVEQAAEVKKPERKKPNSKDPTAKRAKVGKREKVKDSNAAKRSPTDFFVFMDEFRKTFKEANLDSKDVKRVGKEDGEKWRQR
ncbi:putative chromatin remodeling & transcriptional activation HMG family [Medicago truncatula]|uniref:Putative chromatin remodeling & transcriptional activation HMG family n=1 Tax=Medicago truncatula TaxID=3880 RepID=A0A396GDP9_MEDTR|nr:putative chromatin remodeling & transcriptional activation HMG family [Medicago truncatula]